MVEEIIARVVSLTPCLFFSPCVCRKYANLEPGCETSVRTVEKAKLLRTKDGKVNHQYINKTEHIVK